MCVNLAELEREIEITVVHEVAHFLGISEERLEESGYG
jgi:predicted Zn-dependent protease with MMP-like domain